MIKGIIALFTSGAIFNPLVLAGVVSGSWCIIKLHPEQIRGLFLMPHFYGFVALVALLYTVLFAKIYQHGGVKVDLTATLGVAVWNFAKYFIAFILSMSFVMMISIF